MMMTSSWQDLLNNFTEAYAVPNASGDADIGDAVHRCDTKYFMHMLEMSVGADGLLWTDALKESLAYFLGTEGQALHGGDLKVKALCESLWDPQQRALRPPSEEWMEQARAAWY